VKQVCVCGYGKHYRNSQSLQFIKTTTRPATQEWQLLLDSAFQAQSEEWQLLLDQPFNYSCTMRLATCENTQVIQYALHVQQGTTASGAMEC
jgi:hypothetical protein